MEVSIRLDKKILLEKYDQASASFRYDSLITVCTTARSEQSMFLEFPGNSEKISIARHTARYEATGHVRGHPLSRSETFRTFLPLLLPRFCHFASRSHFHEDKGWWFNSSARYDCKFLRVYRKLNLFIANVWKHTTFLVTFPSSRYWETIREHTWSFETHSQSTLSCSL